MYSTRWGTSVHAQDARRADGNRGGAIHGWKEPFRLAACPSRTPGLRGDAPGYCAPHVAGGALARPPWGAPGRTRLFRCCAAKPGLFVPPLDSSTVPGILPTFRCCAARPGLFASRSALLDRPLERGELEMLRSGMGPPSPRAWFVGESRQRQAFQMLRTALCSRSTCVIAKIIVKPQIGPGENEVGELSGRTDNLGRWRLGDRRKGSKLRPTLLVASCLHACRTDNGRKDPLSSGG